jgi:hypothetical protein
VRRFRYGEGPLMTFDSRRTVRPDRNERNKLAPYQHGCLGKRRVRLRIHWFAVGNQRTSSLPSGVEFP